MPGGDADDPGTMTTRHGGRSSRLLVRRLLPPFLVLMVLVLAGAGVLLWKQHQQGLQETIASDAADLAADLSLVQDQQIVEMSALIQTIAADPGVQQALSRRDADGLLAAWQPAFARLRRETQLTHLYFMDKDRVCLLRVHEPDHRGDRISRFTTIEEERTGRIASGIELGVMGSLALRVGQPVIAGGMLVGYVEVGKEIGHILGTLLMRVPSWNQLIVVVRKEQLDPRAWAVSMNRLGRQLAWDRIPGVAVVYASLPRIPDFVASWLIAAADRPDHGDRMAVFPDEDRYWRIVATPLRDASGMEIGSILALHDVMEERAAWMHQLILGGMTSLLLLALMTAFVVILLHRTEAIILAQQDELRNQQWRLENIIDGTRAGAWEWNIQTGLMSCNERWAEIVGHTRAELTPLDRARCEAFIHPEDLGAIHAALRRHYDGASAYFDHICRMRHKAGRWIWVRIRGRVSTRTPLGDPLLMFGTHMDISARIEAEAERDRLQAERRAGELVELMHANRLAALGTLMAGLAHEFNHPAQVVVMNQRSLRTMVEACVAVAREQQGAALGLLTWSEIATLAPAMLDDMETATAYLQELIGHVKHYARPSEGIGERIDSAFLAAVSASSLRLVSSYARRRQVALVSDLAGDGDGTLAGAGRLQQVVVNLLLNAIQASPVGGSVQLAMVEQEGQFRLSIADDGTGIDPAVIARLGQPFTTTRASTGGSGLGLYICLRLVAELGGTIELTSRQPHGTMAVVRFPCRDRQV